MENVKVLNKGQIVIPAGIRKRHNIKPGAMIQIYEYGNLIYIVPPSDDPVREAMGFLPIKPSLGKDLLAQRNKDFK